MRPISVYLDSSDYSVLSDVERITPELSDLKTKLLQWVKSREIECRFSGVHLSEMAPLDARFTDAAVQRADLMIELCGRQALISQSSLISQEVNRLHRPELIIEPFSDKGVWYPDDLSNLVSISGIDMRSEFSDALGKLNLNRKMRRATEKKSIKKGALRQNLKKAMRLDSRSIDLSDILQNYPMRSHDARVLARYAVGDATAEEANNAFEESLRDPRWMMQWFREHHDKLSPFAQLVRAPGQPMVDAILQIIKLAQSSRQMDSAYGTSLESQYFTMKAWATQQDLLLTRVAKKLISECTAEGDLELTPLQIDEYLPSVSVGIRSIHSAWHGSVVAERGRQPKSSDFADALHAMYAPYVDVFRADSFMAPHIERHAKSSGVTVVNKLRNLRLAIESIIKARGTIK